MRADHALDFKRTEALHTGEFNDYLISLNINHQYSFWNQPQTNGKIERLHKQIDDELLPLINRCNTIQEALELINRWYVVYNTDRTRGYKIWNQNLKKWDSYRMTPIQSLNYDFQRYT